MAGILDINTVNAGSIYPRAGFKTASPMGPSEAAPRAQAGGDPIMERVLRTVSGGKPVAWWVAFAVFMIALMWFASRTGVEGFSNIKLSFYNVIVIALASVLGTSLLKIAFTMFPIKGLSSFILAG